MVSPKGQVGQLITVVDLELSSPNVASRGGVLGIGRRGVLHDCYVALSSRWLSESVESNEVCIHVRDVTDGGNEISPQQHDQRCRSDSDGGKERINFA